MSYASTTAKLIGLSLVLAAANVPSIAKAPDWSVDRPLKRSDQAKFFAWIDKLGLSEPVKGKAVRLTYWFKGDPQTTYSEFGFLVNGSSDHFKVVTPRLETYIGPTDHRFRSRNELTKIDFVDFESSAKAMFAKNLYNKTHNPEVYSVDTTPLSGLELVMMSRACKARGLSSLASKFFVQACDTQADVNGTKISLREQVSQNAAGECERTLVDPDQPRKRALSQVRAFVKSYPFSSRVPYMRAAIPVLETMVREDAQRSREAGQDLSKTDTSAQVNELIYRLRDEQAYQFSNPGSPDIYGAWPSGDPKSDDMKLPASQLAKLGYEAVPQLIEHLTDRRFTKCVGFRNQDWGSVYRVGDVCQLILERIACRQFEPAYNDFPTPEICQARIQKMAQVWWADAKIQGDRAMVIAQVNSGRDGANTGAQRLIDAYPADAFDAIVKGLPKANGFIQAELIRLLGELPNKEIPELAKYYMDHGTGAQTRFYAAEIVARSDTDLAVKVMTKAWLEINSHKGEDGFGVADFEYLSFLLGAGTPEGVRAVVDEVKRTPKPLRYYVLQDLSSGTLPPDDHEFRSGNASKKTASKPYQRAVETLLGEYLQVTDLLPNDGVAIAGRRVCDVAALCMANFWPKRYQFDEKSSPENRQEQRLKCLDTWRRAHSRVK